MNRNRRKDFKLLNLKLIFPSYRYLISEKVLQNVLHFIFTVKDGLINAA